MTSFGIKTSPQHTTFEDIVTVWQEADQIESIEHAWLYDHFAPAQGSIDGPVLEGWTTLASLAVLTKRLRLGLMVTGNTYRHPAVLAKIASTIDVISGGRLDLGIGAGWNVFEHESLGIPLYQPGERLRRMDEACDVIKGLFTEPVFSYDGRYYQLKEARCEPKPVQKPWPPFVIGGGGEKLTLRIVAKQADIWNHNGSGVDDFKHKVGVLHRHCAEIGRDPNEITLSYQCWLGENYGDSVETIKPFLDAGATHVVLVLPPPHGPGLAERAANEVIAKLS